MKIENNEITVLIKPEQLANLCYSNGVEKEEIVLNVLRYTINDDGILKNRKGEIVGSKNRQGYEKIQIRLGGKSKDIFTHRIQAFKKYGRKMYDKGIQVRHLNDIKTDNRASNIALGTARDNYQDRGKDSIAAAQKRATEASTKYSNELIEKARAYYEKTNSLKETSEKFNIPAPSLHYRLKGKKKQIR